ncbi:carboxylesterase/lipase family protein [Pseudomonas aeruginosa]|uniref:carboxylesterase/lipase family protein n=1 Tax=Pseudomonas aeruginosa TaxID=287 RepID=UPI000EAE2581|nr:carboxylesterase family protein [Pseudomonas aeruginosa]
MKSISPDPESLRITNSGPVIGSLERGNVHSWKGIPYACPPTGTLRWRAPRQVTPWQEVRQALAYGHMAPQYAGLLAPVSKHLHGEIVGDEDCLTLNVFAPSWGRVDVPTGRALRPVMVWIHGGGNAVGTSASYDVLMNYAAESGIVVVSINYRLGILGWFCLHGFHSMPGYSQEELSGNFGTLDIICALRWVKDNVSVFGGDPENVTIFGESAGAQNVLTLLVSPLAAGLFQRAIAQSPVAETYSIDEATNPSQSPLSSLNNSSSKLIDDFIAASAGKHAETAHELSGRDRSETLMDFLRSLSVRELLGVFTPGSAGIYLSPRPVRDGVVIPREGLKETFVCGEWNRVPVIIGSNRDEYRTFLADKPEHSRLLFGRVPILKHRKSYVAESNFLSSAWRAMHVDEIADAMVAGGHKDVWSYRFDWDEAPAIPFVRPDILLGAAHAMEMSFAFGDIQGEFDIFGVNTPFNKRSRCKLAKEMSGAWVSFAANGVPTVSSSDGWRRHYESLFGSASLVFDGEKDGGIRMESLRMTISDLKKQLFDACKFSPSTCCSIYARAFLWSPLFHRWGSHEEFEALRAKHKCVESAEYFRPKMEI